MQKLYILVILSLFFNIKSLHAATPIDSIGVENYNGKKVIVHKIEPKETYYALGRKYNVNPKDIISFNDNKALNPGTIVRVPTNRPYGTMQTAGTTPPAPAPATQTNTTHVVKAKENLGMIAEKYGITLDALRKANGITGSALSIGQVLKIPVAGQTQNKVADAPEKSVSETATYIDHVVQKKEFLNKIAEQYHTTVDELKRVNNLSSNNLSIGQVLKVPSANGKPLDNKPVVDIPKKTEKEVVQTSNNNGTRHTVASGETIFSIAHKYGLTTYQIKQANNLDDNSVLSVGQQLNIPVPATPRSVNEASKDGDDAGSDTTLTIKDPSLRRNAAVYGLNQAEEKGAAIWITDPDLDATKMMVLHRTLKVGSVIKVTNPMTKISALVKVVGKFTENESTKDVIIVVTKAVADSLGVLDKRFYCTITYALIEDEQ